MDPLGIAIFCDDIREEVGGKFSLIGCYANDIQFIDVSFPITIPKLAVFAVARLPPEPVTPQLQILVYLPGDSEGSPAAKFEFQGPLLNPYTNRDLETHLDLEKSHSLRCPILLSPVIFKEEGFIRVRLLYGQQRIRLGALKVHTLRSAPPSAAT
jgi:hypothetical protein